MFYERAFNANSMLISRRTDLSCWIGLIKWILNQESRPLGISTISSIPLTRSFSEPLVDNDYPKKRKKNYSKFNEYIAIYSTDNQNIENRNN